MDGCVDVVSVVCREFAMRRDVSGDGILSPLPGSALGGQTPSSRDRCQVLAAPGDGGN